MKRNDFILLILLSLSKTTLINVQMFSDRFQNEQRKVIAFQSYFTLLKNFENTPVQVLNIFKFMKESIRSR